MLCWVWTASRSGLGRVDVVINYSGWEDGEVLGLEKSCWVGVDLGSVGGESTGGRWMEGFNCGCALGFSRVVDTGNLASKKDCFVVLYLKFKELTVMIFFQGRFFVGRIVFMLFLLTGSYSHPSLLTQKHIYKILTQHSNASPRMHPHDPPL